MAIRTYVKDGEKLFEAYINGFNSRGTRVQRKQKGIESLRKAELVEFELRRELALLKEEWGCGPSDPGLLQVAWDH